MISMVSDLYFSSGKEVVKSKGTSKTLRFDATPINLPIRQVLDTPGSNIEHR